MLNNISLQLLMEKGLNCDGVGGTVNRLATRASLQRPYDHQIMTPRLLYEWASEQWLLHTVLLMEGIFLHDQFQQSRTIPCRDTKATLFYPFNKKAPY